MQSQNAFSTYQAEAEFPVNNSSAGPIEGDYNEEEVMLI